MIYAPPSLHGVDREVLALIAEQKERLRIYTQHNPRRWLGSLRRNTFARAIQGSNSIEGYNASIEDAIAVIEDELPLDERTETWYAIKGYRDAMTYIMQASQDPYFELGRQFLKSLHFMMIGFDMSKYPGQWRPGGIYVVNSNTGSIVYEGPSAETVDILVQELVNYLLGDVSSDSLVRAAMAHLNLTMIHPFKDGNGRMARALQTFVLAKGGILHPIFSSIEEWIGRNTQEYYDILASIGKGKWNPAEDSLPWVRFCLKAHYQQAATLIRRNEEYEKLYNEISKIVEQEKLPDRVTLPLFNAALGFPITNSRYRADAEVSEFVASRDLRRLSEARLLTPRGEKRGRTYSISENLRAIRNSVRIRRELENPYDIIENRVKNVGNVNGKPRIPGL